MITAIVITLNEEKLITDCLKSLHFVDQIIVVDTGNTDNTNEIAKKFRANVIKYSGPKDYSAFRNYCIPKSKGDWLLYIDADERVTPGLATELENIVKHSSEFTAFAIPRINYYLGKNLKHGGWGEDYVIRFIKKSALEKWVNPLHEQPVFTGKLLKLSNSLVHISHRDLSSMTLKTLGFTKHEAELRFNSLHPKMVWWRFFRVILTEFWTRFIKYSAWRDGAEGIIDGIFQIYNTIIIYIRLWEMQNESANN